MARHESRMLALGWAPYLTATAAPLTPIEFLGRRYVRVQPLIADAVRAMEQALIYTGYENPCDWTGSYNYRSIAGTDVWSTHAYGTAIDLDYGYAEADRLVDKNPHLHRPVQPADFGVNCQLTQADVDAIESIKNKQGRKMWRWLGWSIGDTMHFQIDVAPEETEVDWSTVPGFVLPPQGEDEELDEFYQKIFDEWSYSDLEQMNFRGWWSGDTDYFKAAGASPAFDDVKNLVRKCLANGIAKQSFVFSAFDGEELTDQVNLLEASLDDTQAKLRSV